MLGAALFIALWVLLGVGVFFVAVRGGPGGARAVLQTQTHGGRRAAAVLFTVASVGLGVAVPLVLLIGNHSHASAQVGGVRLNAGDKRGRDIFGHTCGSCRTPA